MEREGGDGERYLVDKSFFQRYSKGASLKMSMG